MIISIASGKGGTGKTTVATNLAAAIGTDVQLVDCDVEEPNAHLFMKPVFQHTETIFAAVPDIDPDLCTRCRKCTEICRFKAIAIAGQSILTFPELCHSCGGCMAVCDEKAITESGRKLGVLESGYFKAGEFVHGRLRVGEAMSPPLIRKVRSFANKDKISIIDAPPGASCPVIAAIKDTDFVLMVTEPTPFGLHDLKLVAAAVKLLGIPCGLVINRSDVGNDDVKRYARAEKLPVLMEIPFDRGIAETYSRGQLVIEIMPEFKKKFLALRSQIDRLIG
ncbi:MinD superfamily P-loop ATPase containing an inserted ferredoxin domain [Olavius algarvensis Delta 1 endosymbiont]|nr:MinD superfamily P-loop ATPase containing an inserted ferredoxin domain [Olavius algarvensis Delta 1 endosymbiont]